MTKKLWISVKRGFIRDPKHRFAVGECVWLFEFMLDSANWEDGIVHEWKDKLAAEEMDMPLDTLRYQRKKLEEAGYITCVQRQYSQDILIHNWTNPREYTGANYNPRQGGNEFLPQEDGQGRNQGSNQGSNQGTSQITTPTYSSKIKDQRDASIQETIEEANKTVDFILEQAKRAKYPFRDRLPEALIPYCDKYVELTGQQPRKTVLHDWIATFSEWHGAGITPDHMALAFKEASRRDIAVLRPGSLDKLAAAMQGKSVRVSESAPKQTITEAEKLRQAGGWTPYSQLKRQEADHD